MPANVFYAHQQSVWCVILIRVVHKRHIAFRTSCVWSMRVQLHMAAVWRHIQKRERGAFYNWRRVITLARLGIKSSIHAISTLKKEMRALCVSLRWRCFVNYVEAIHQFWYEAGKKGWDEEIYQKNRLRVCGSSFLHHKLYRIFCNFNPTEKFVSGGLRLAE